MKRSIILYLFIFYFSSTFSSCNPNTTNKSVDETPKLRQSEIKNFLVVLFSYEDTNNKLPSSIEGIEAFCEANPNLQCQEIDWSRFTLRELEQNKVEIQYKRADYSIPFVIETSPHLMDTSGDPNKYIEDKLREILDSQISN